MTQPVKPMLAATKTPTNDQIEELLTHRGYFYCSPKLDGIRCMVQNETALSRTLKLIRNSHIQQKLSQSILSGFDGELIVGSRTAHDVYRQTNSAVMRKAGEPDFTFWVFDNCLQMGAYESRSATLNESFPFVKILESKKFTTLAEILDYETQCLNAGYEGIILRHPYFAYKHGRSTLKLGNLLKIKRFTDGEAEILSTNELLHNHNEKKTNELGRGQRSSHKENKVGGNTLGSFTCRDLESKEEFDLGTGFDAATRQELWNDRANLIGKFVKYKSFKIGVKDAPRHPVFLGMRDKDDM